MSERALCGACDGNGVLKIPGGVSVCDRCRGDCWEPSAGGREDIQRMYDVTTWLLSECPTGRMDLGATQEYHDALLALTNERARLRNQGIVEHNEDWWHRSRRAQATRERER